MSTPNSALFPDGKAPAVSDPANFPDLLGEIYEIREAFLRNIGAWNFLPVQRGGAAPASPSPYQIWIQVPASLSGSTITNPDAVMWDPAAGAWVPISPTMFGRAMVYYGGGGGGMSSVIHNVTLSGDGTSGAPLAVVPSALNGQVEVAVQAPITGTGLTASPLTVSASTTSARGSVELATNAECVAGTDAVRAVTPAGLAAAIAAIPGFTLVANAPVTGNGTSGSPLDVSYATTTAEGAVELATNAECIAGTDTIRSVTPAGLKAALDAKTVARNAPLTGNGTTASPLDIDFCALDAADQACIGGMVAPCLSVLGAAPTTPGPRMYVDDTVSPFVLYVWNCTSGAYEAVQAGQQTFTASADGTNILGPVALGVGGKCWDVTTTGLNYSATGGSAYLEVSMDNGTTWYELGRQAVVGLPTNTTFFAAGCTYYAKSTTVQNGYTSLQESSFPIMPGTVPVSGSSARYTDTGVGMGGAVDAAAPGPTQAMPLAAVQGVQLRMRTDGGVNMTSGTLSAHIH